MKAVQLLVNSVLPPDLRNYDQTYDTKSLNKILHAVALKHEDQFADVEKKISDIGRKASYYQGETISLKDLASPIDRSPYYDAMEAEIKSLPKDKNFEDKRNAIMQKYNDIIEKETSKAALGNRNNIAMSVLSGARGKSAQLKAMTSTPGIFADYKSRVIPVFSKESFSEGIRPAVFLASTYGARASVVSTKCLDYQSLVKMADLSEKRLCDIQPGDMVLGADKEGKVFPVKVLNVFDQGEKECYKYTFRSSILEPDTIEPIGTVICTKDHKFLSAKHGCPLPIEESHKSNRMHPGVKWKLSDGSAVVTTEAEPIGKVHCMDIEVDHPDHLFVLANGLITSNSATAKGGDLAKQLASSSADLVVRKEDCHTDNGIELSVDDNSLRGRALAKDVAGIKAGTFIGRNELDKIRKSGAESVIVRSPITCSVSNGLCAHCVGRFYNGSKLPKVGDAIGLLASSTVGEPLCLVKGTEVRMADGSVKKIEDIEPGEYVLGSDMSGHCTPVKVVNKFHNGPRECYRSYIKKSEGGKKEYLILESTSAHKILGAYIDKSNPSAKPELDIAPIGLISEQKEMVRMCQCITSVGCGTICRTDGAWFGKELGEGCIDTFDAILSDNSNCNLFELEKQEYMGICDTWDIEVDNDTHLFALANGLIVSNTQMALCLEEDTEIRMADGSVKYIKDIEPGDMVLGSDTDGTIEPTRVLAKFKQGTHKVKEYTISVPAEGGYTSAVVKCTPMHKFLHVSKKIVPIGSNIAQGDGSFVTVHGVGMLTSATPPTDAECYDIEVDHPDHLFVLANGLITSNSAKHTAGMASGKKSYSGLPTIIQFTQSPEAFKDRGAVSELDGKVTDVSEAPQGGMFVTVGDKKHYVLPGHEVYVKPGDTVEAGDQLAEGLVDPEDIVRLKGLGDGKLYYAERLNQMLADSGAGTDKRNTEVLARGAIRHIKITNPEGMGVYLPDDLVDYNAVQKTFKVPDTAKEMNPKAAVGKYLQKPYLHYTVGTKVTPSVAKKLARNSYNSLLVDDEAPGFEPYMVRLRTASHTNPDWMASLATSSIAKQLNDSATRGDDTNIESNPDYRPRLAVGENFGKNVGVSGEF